MSLETQSVTQKLTNLCETKKKRINKSILSFLLIIIENINRNIKTVNFIETNDNKYGNGARNGDEESSQPMLRFMDNAQIDSVSNET